MKIFAPDTNFFLQCKSADQVEWKLLTEEKEIVLLVVREVRKELDRLKNGGNQRRSKRARAASAILRRFTSEGVHEIELRATAPRVLLRIAQRPSAGALPPDYRIESADERIVAEVYAANNEKEEGITFLSHDTVPLEDAAALGLRTKIVPDGWLLEPEPNDVDRELGDVKRRMKALEGRSPDVVIRVPIDDDGYIKLQSPYFPPLSDDFISEAMRKVRRKHVIGASGEVSSRVSKATTALEMADEAKWIKYVNDHAKWLDGVEFTLHNVWFHMNEDPNGMKLPIEIENRGSIAAENLIIRIEPRGDFYMVDVDALEMEENPFRYFPEPPTRPRSRFAVKPAKTDDDDDDLEELRSELARRLEAARSPTSPTARDRHILYWKYDGDRHARSVEGQCQDFRHGLPPEELVLSLERLVIGDDPVRGALEILVSAGNVPEAKKVIYPVHIEPKAYSTEDFIRMLLRRELDVDV